MYSVRNCAIDTHILNKLKCFIYLLVLSTCSTNKFLFVLSFFSYQRTTRGVTCDVWAGLYLDDEANRNFTIEWYFTQVNFTF